MSRQTILKFDKSLGFDSKQRHEKLTISALALAIDYFSTEAIDEAFCKEARSCIRAVGPTNKVMVSKFVHDKVMDCLPVQKAIDICLLR